MKYSTSLIPSLFILLLMAACFSPTPSKETKALVNIYEGPVTTFNQSCRDCHDENDADYGNNLQTLSDDELYFQIRSMMNGPAKIIAPSEEEICAMTEYHRALRNKQLFLMVTNGESASNGSHTELKGNVTPGARVELHTDDTVLKAHVKDGVWILDRFPQPPFELVAQKGDQTTSFRFPDRQWN